MHLLATNWRHLELLPKQHIMNLFDFIMFIISTKVTWLNLGSRTLKNAFTNQQLKVPWFVKKKQFSHSCYNTVRFKPLLFISHYQHISLLCKTFQINCKLYQYVVTTPWFLSSFINKALSIFYLDHRLLGEIYCCSVKIMNVNTIG